MPKGMAFGGFIEYVELLKNMRLEVTDMSGCLRLRNI